MKIFRLIRKARRAKFEPFNFDEDNAQDKFNLYWEPLRSVLDGIQALKLPQDEKIDEAIGKVIALGDMVYTGHADRYPEFIYEVRQIIDVIEDLTRATIGIIESIKKYRSRRGKPTARADKAISVLAESFVILNWVSKS